MVTLSKNDGPKAESDLLNVTRFDIFGDSALVPSMSRAERAAEEKAREADEIAARSDAALARAAA